MPSVLSAKHFHDEAAAYAFVEERVWPDGPTCPHCGGVERIGKLNGKSTRIGVYKCYQCRSKFTVKVGTVFESSHVPLHIWLQAVALLTASKKGISAPTSFTGPLASPSRPLGSCRTVSARPCATGRLPRWAAAASIVEADETYQGRRSTPRDVTTSGRPFIKKGKKGTPAKRAIIALVERGGNVRSFHVENADKATVNQIVGREHRPARRTSSPTKAGSTTTLPDHAASHTRGQARRWRVRPLRGWAGHPLQHRRNARSNSSPNSIHAKFAGGLYEPLGGATPSAIGRSGRWRRRLPPGSSLMIGRGTCRG